MSVETELIRGLKGRVEGVKKKDEGNNMGFGKWMGKEWDDDPGMGQCGE